MASQWMVLSKFQQKVIDIPEEYDVALLGGRAGGKSYTLATLALRHVAKYKRNARVLYIRRSHAGLVDFQEITRELFSKAFGNTARYNQTSGLWRFSNGGSFELNQLENRSEFNKFQGRSQSLLLIDEAGQYPEPDLLDLLRSNLRGPAQMPLRMVIAANPGGEGHQWILRRYANAKPWEPFCEPKSKRIWVTAPSTYKDNEFIDQDNYKDQLEGISSDPELLKAWLSGSWHIARGAYFGDTFDEDRNIIERWDEIPKHRGQLWENWLAHDFGSSAPSATYIIAKSPGANGPDGKWYSRGSLIAVDELSTAKSLDRLNEGLGYTVPVLSEMIVEMCQRWGVRAAGVADDAIFAKGRGQLADSIADEFRRCKVDFKSARKLERIGGWQLLRRLLQDAQKPDVPGLYISRNCEYLLATLPFIGRDPKRPEDVFSGGSDHFCDAIRYGCLKQRNEARLIQLTGT